MGRWTRNADVVERLSPDLQEKYDFAFAWESVCSLYQGIPGLRGFWPMSSVSTGLAIDLSGQARHLTAAGVNPYFGSDVLIPWFHADEANPDYLVRADEPGLDISGGEAYINNAQKGVTIGAWVKFSNPAPPNTDMIISKGQFTVPGNTSYGLYRRAAAAGGRLRAYFSDGVAAETVDSVAAVPVNQWVFTAAKWASPVVGGGDQSACFLNNVKAEVSPTGLAAGLNNTGATLQIMGRYDPATVTAENTTGFVSLAFLSVMALHDGAIIALYERSRALFGV